MTTQSVVRVMRVGMLLLVAVAVFGAGWVLYAQWHTVVADSNPDLNPVERFYLQSYMDDHQAALQSPAGAGTIPQPFVVTPGESAKQIAAALSTANLLTDAELFINYVRYHGLDSQLEAGEFLLDPRWTVPDLAQALTESERFPREVELRFLAGWRAEEIANYLRVVQPAAIDADQFLAIVKRQRPFSLASYSFLASLPANGSLEGYLFPGSYRIATNMEAAELIDAMLTRFGEQVTPTMRQSFGAHGLSLREAVILASIVEKEAVIAEERPLIAGVFLNRMTRNMRLQADPTAQYALGYQPATDSWWKSPLLGSDLAIDSPYNTYVADGLPPGPIANPSLSSLQAVAEPEMSNFIYFVAHCDNENVGKHQFSVTYEEHLFNVQQCQ